MQMHTLVRRGLAAGAGSALVLGALAATAPTASATPATNVYACGNTGLGVAPFDVTVTSDVPELALFPSVTAGAKVPAGYLSLNNKVTIPASAAALFTSFGVSKLDMTGYAISVGDATATADALTVAPTAFTANADGSKTADVNGKNVDLEIPAAGTYDITGPTTFPIVATTSIGPATLTCDIKAGTTPASIGSIVVNEGKSSLTATTKNTEISASDKAKIKVAIATEQKAATGKVTAWVGKKKVGKATLNKKGKAKIVVKGKKLSTGKNKVKITFDGDDYNGAAKGKVKIKVVG